MNTPQTLPKKAIIFPMVSSTKSRHGLTWWNLKSSCRAFSLIEVTIALGIVMFAVVPMVALLPVAQKSYSDSKRATVYANIIQQLNQEANLVNFSTAASLATTNYYDDQGVEIITGSTANWGYKAVVTVTSTNTAWTSTSTSPYPNSLSSYSASTYRAQVILNDHSNVNTPTTNNFVLFNQGL